MKNSFWLSWWAARKRPSEKDFGGIPIPSPIPAGLRRISNHGNPDSPICVSLSGGQNLWMRGWLAPLNSTTAGMSFYFNGQKTELSQTKLIPTYFPKLDGCISIVCPGVDLTVLTQDGIVSAVFSQMKQNLRTWIKDMDTETFDIMLRPHIEISKELQHLILQDEDYQKLFFDHFQFETSQGPKTLRNLFPLYHDDMMMDKFTIHATSALRTWNSALYYGIDKKLPLLDLTELYSRGILLNIIERKGGKIDFIDNEDSSHWGDAFERKGRNSDEEWLLKFFISGFKKTESHRGVKVAIDADGVLGEFPAMIFTTNPLPGQYLPGLTEELMLKHCIKNSLLLINPKSELAHVILGFKRNTEDSVKHGPVAVHTTATLFSVGAFPDSWKHLHWNHVKELLFHLHKSEQQLIELIAERKQYSANNSKIKELESLIIETQKELEKTKKELNAAEALIGNPF